MPRNIPIALQSAIASSHQTWCYLMRVDPTRPEYSAYGVTSLDADVTYDDGISELTYVAAVGMVPTTLISTADNAVTEQEAQSLVPEGLRDEYGKARPLGGMAFVRLKIG